MKAIHLKSFLIGIACALPFTVLNAAVVTKFEPVLAVLRPLGETTGFEQVIIFILLAISFVGGVVALLPALKKDETGRRPLYFLNVFLAAFLIVSSVGIAYALGVETYRCDVLEIPNCD